MVTNSNEYMKNYMKERRVGLSREVLEEYWRKKNWYIETAVFNHGYSYRGTLYKGDIEKGAAQRFPIWHIVVVRHPKKEHDAWFAIDKFFRKEVDRYERWRAASALPAEDPRALAEHRDWRNWEGSP